MPENGTSLIADLASGLGSPSAGRTPLTIRPQLFDPGDLISEFRAQSVHYRTLLMKKRHRHFGGMPAEVFDDDESSPHTTSSHARSVQYRPRKQAADR